MKNKGFTLIELMIVVAIIAIIAAIAIPNLLRSRLQSNEAATIGNLKTLVGAETAFSAANGGYTGTWAQLRPSDGSPMFLDIVLDATGGVSGYGYTLASAGSAAGVGGAFFTDFNCTAEPLTRPTTGNRGFYVDASGVIRFEPAATATATSDPI